MIENYSNLITDVDQFRLLSEGLGFNLKPIKSVKDKTFRPKKMQTYELSRKIMQSQKSLEKLNTSQKVAGLSIKLFSFILDTFFILFLSMLLTSFLKIFIGDIFYFYKKIIFVSFIINNIILYSLVFYKNRSFADFFFKIKYKSASFNFYFIKLFNKNCITNV